MSWSLHLFGHICLQCCCWSFNSISMECGICLHFFWRHWIQQKYITVHTIVNFLPSMWPSKMFNTSWGPLFLYSHRPQTLSRVRLLHQVRLSTTNLSYGHDFQIHHWCVSCARFAEWGSWHSVHAWGLSSDIFSSSQMNDSYNFSQSLIISVLTCISLSIICIPNWE